MDTFAETYSKLSDDEILNLANGTEGLTEPARAALAVELERRGLSAPEVSAYKEYLQERDLLEKKRHVGRSFRGFGTTVYGRRDFWPDGSFVSTEWIILFWIPVLPIRSLRLTPGGPARFRFRTLLGSYRIDFEEKLHWEQVFSVYAILVVIFCWQH